MNQTAKIGGWEFDVKTQKSKWTEETARIYGLEPGTATNIERELNLYQGESRRKI